MLIRLVEKNDAAAIGRSIARAMCEHSLSHAKARGFRAMQFNFVVGTNERAVEASIASGCAPGEAISGYREQRGEPAARRRRRRAKSNGTKNFRHAL
jgi:hypothetical protein